MKIKAKPLRTKNPLQKILVLRFHALGDIMITLPYLASLKKNIPSISLTLLTSDEFSDIPRNITLFDEVVTFNSHRSGKLQFILNALKLPLLWSKRFDIVLDLQNNRSSRFLRHLLFPKAWSEFDKSSREYAGERARYCIDALGLCETKIETDIPLKDKIRFQKLAEQYGLINNQFVVINPAGTFPSRNWPIERYIEFCNLWSSKFPETQFVIFGLNALKPKSSFIKNALKEKLIDLSGKTSQAEAFALIKMARMILTEDGGLMHMTWTQGVPTVALFGSTPAYWSSPLGDWSVCLNSSDLPCGNCLLEHCQFGDNRCLTRYSAKFVFEKSLELLSKAN